MKYFFAIVILFVAGFKLGASFVIADEPAMLFGGEVNIWLYRAVWLFAGCISVYTIIRERNKKKE
jgi:hypothetical protein